MGKMKLGTWGVIFLLVIGIVGTAWYFDAFDGAGAAFSITGADGEDLTCDGISSINLLYNDKNAQKIGTDPGDNITIYEVNGEPYSKVINDDDTSSTIPIQSTYKGLAGNNLGTPVTDYFAVLVEGTTACADLDLQTSVQPSGAVSIAILNDNGVTLNSDSNDEDMAASSQYTACATVKAATETSGNEYGAIVVFEYDATFVSKVESNDLTGSSTGYFEPHANATYDQYKVFEWNIAPLRDGDKEEFCFDVTTTSATPAEDSSDIHIVYVPKNIDLDADTLQPITGIYDEDNNMINVTSTHQTYYIN